MPDPGIVRDNKARNDYADFANFLGGGSKPKISTNTPANKIQSNQFTAGHGMDPGQKARSSIPGLNNKTVRPAANTTADRNMMNQARRPTTTGAGTPMGAVNRAINNMANSVADRNMMRQSQRPVTTTPAAPVIDSADRKFMPQLPSSTGSTASSYNMSAPNNTNLFGYDPTPAAPKVDSADIKFMPSADGTPSSYDLTAPNNQGLLGYQAPAAMPTDPLGVNFDMGILEEAVAMQPPPVMPPMGGIPDMGGDYGGAPVGGNTGNLGTFDPFASDEYLRFGSELAGLENQEGMVDESRDFWDISQDRKWDEVMRQIPGLFNQRGMADSGLLNRANALSLGDREFETAVRDWMDENQKSAINRGQMAAEQGLMQSQLQNMFDMFGSGAITPMNQPTINQMNPMGVFNQTADAIAQGPRDYYGTNPTMDQLNAFNTGTAGMSADQKDALSRLFASKAGMI